MADYRMNLELAQFKPLSAEQRRLLEAVRGNQEATNQFLMAREGMIAPETFFNPQNLRRIGADATSMQRQLHRIQQESHRTPDSLSFRSYRE